MENCIFAIAFEKMISNPRGILIFFRKNNIKIRRRQCSSVGQSS